jgi:hypothetical protein
MQAIISDGDKSKPGESNLSEEIKVQQEKLFQMQQKLQRRKQMQIKSNLI